MLGSFQVLAIFSLGFLWQPRRNIQFQQFKEFLCFGSLLLWAHWQPRKNIQFHYLFPLFSYGIVLFFIVFILPRWWFCPHTKQQYLVAPAWYPKTVWVVNKCLWGLPINKQTFVVLHSSSQLTLHEKCFEICQFW